LRGRAASGASRSKGESNALVIKNRDTGKYAARPGLNRSYTVKLKEVRLFINRAAAQSECCGNEIVEELKPAN